jgi:hypothetical protein
MAGLAVGITIPGFSFVIEGLEVASLAFDADVGFHRHRGFPDMVDGFILYKTP